MAVIDKDFFNKMVEFFRSNKGQVFALYTPKKNELVKFNGKYVPLKQVTKDIDKFLKHCQYYIDNYKLYPDEPFVTISNDYKLINISKSWQETTLFTTLKRGFYERS